MINNKILKLIGLFILGMWSLQAVLIVTLMTSRQMKCRIILTA